MKRKARPGPGRDGRPRFGRVVYCNGTVLYVYQFALAQSTKETHSTRVQLISSPANESVSAISSLSARTCTKYRYIGTSQLL